MYVCGCMCVSVCVWVYVCVCLCVWLCFSSHDILLTWCLIIGKGGLCTCFSLTITFFLCVSLHVPLTLHFLFCFIFYSTCYAALIFPPCFELPLLYLCMCVCLSPSFPLFVPPTFPPSLPTLSLSVSLSLSLSVCLSLSLSLSLFLSPPTPPLSPRLISLPPTSFLSLHQSISCFFTHSHIYPFTITK